MDVNGSFGSCWLSVWWKCFLGNQATSSSWVAEFLLFCLSPVGEKSVLVNFGLPLSICGIGYTFHQSYTNHNSIWFESQPWHFRKKCDKANHQSGQKQAIHTTANRITRGLLAGRLSAFRCADVVDWLRWTSSRDEAFMTWKSCKKRMLRIYMISLCTQHRMGNLLFPCSILFFRLFSKNNIQLGHKDFTEQTVFNRLPTTKIFPTCF